MTTFIFLPKFEGSSSQVWNVINKFFRTCYFIALHFVPRNDDIFWLVDGTMYSRDGSCPWNAEDSAAVKDGFSLST